MSSYRYFIVPEGVITVSELPEKWGLVEVTSKGHIKVRSGHVLLKNRDEDVWRHERHNQYAEICTLAMVVNRVGDAQKIQDWINKLSKAAKANEELKKRNSELSHELYLLKERIELDE